ncbi:hypothetical protein GCAAIG_03865 [Candidatus Electronema halotolerans]
MTNTFHFIKKNKKIIQSFSGAILIGIVIWQSNPEKLYNQIFDVPLYYLIPCFLLYYLLVTLTWAVGIYFLLIRIKKDTFWKIIKSSFKLQVIAAITPGRLGDIGLLYYLKGEYTSGQLGAIFFIDKLITLGINIVISIIGFGILLSWKYAVVISFFLIAIFSLLICFLFKFPQKFINWGIFKNIIVYLQGFRVELNATARDIKGIAGNVVLTLVRYILAGGCMLLALLWFGQHVTLINVILIQAVAQLATFIPLTTMGLGVTEAVCISLFITIGVSSEMTLAALLWSRAIYLMFIAGIYLLWTGMPVYYKVFKKITPAE